MSLSPTASPLARLVATGLGLGHLRPAPGTWASAATVILVYLLASLAGPWPVAALAAVATLAGLWASGAVLAGSQERDPSEVVIDEVAGQSLALLPAVFGSVGYAGPMWHLWPAWVMGFMLFRLFDIWKPWIIGRIDRRGDALGLMGDDLVAGALTAVLTMAAAGIYHGALGL